MAAKHLISECLEKIFSNLLDNNNRNHKSTKDIHSLHSCTLVSRHWCRISTPFLYSYPFHYFYHRNSNNSNKSSYFKLIRTLLGCIPKSEIEQIISVTDSSNIQKLLSNSFRSNKKSTSSFDISTTFNYVNFIRGLVVDDTLLSDTLLFYFREIWLPPYISNIKTQNKFSKISISIINHLLKYILKHCNNLTVLDLPFIIRNNEIGFDMIKSLIYEDYIGKNKLRNLKELYANSVVKDNEKKDLYLVLSNNIWNLNLLYNEGFKSVDSLCRFISLQKNLKHIILSEYVCEFERGYRDYNSVFNSLSTQCESLQILEFKYLTFNENSLGSLCLLKNIKELKIYECKGIEDNLISWAKNLSKLEVFEFVKCYNSIVSEEFLIQLIETSSNTLLKLIISYKRKGKQLTQLYKHISIYSNSLIYLDLPKIYPDELIKIFESCIKLVYICTILSDDGDWEMSFRNLGKFIPKNLQKIIFKEINAYILSGKALKCFFEDCRNNNGNLKYLEIKGKFIFGQHYFDIAKEFDIELKIQTFKSP
ncbi:unnamed protein product [Rhizophagus irregularis]|uniref:F-box domain-containing protein n=3 Tax=Rhizophagus irregularis TaxID=588596 RepID=A0A916EF96_9GLOM|nr:unnamed protein product [Rhizophagus irregularis]CAB5383193.1 unnamed protein product [Rhizophagus irregularis]